MSFDNPDTSFSFEADPFGPIGGADFKARNRTSHAVRFVPLVANSQVLCIDEVLEGLASAWIALGRNPLIVDAASTSPVAPAAAALDLGACVQTFAGSAAYLAAGDLPRRHVDTHGSAARLLTELQRAAPHADTIVVHADATDLARIFKHRQAQPLLMAVDEPESLKQAYAGWKWLSMRCEWVNARLLVAQASSERADQIAQTLAHCADQFMGAALVGWSTIDKRDAHAPRPQLLELAAAQLGLHVRSDQSGSSWPLRAQPSLAKSPFPYAQGRH
jgi:hypothetical protein